MRLLVNTTIGVGGIFDVATGWGWPTHDTDAGITLALWGLPKGPYLFLPVLGPSSPRDATGFGGDIAEDPLTWVGNGEVVSALGWTPLRADRDRHPRLACSMLDKIEQTALDPYATIPQPLPPAPAIPDRGCPTGRSGDRAGVVCATAPPK